MPICKREGFDNAPSKSNKNETFHDNDDVFFCEVTMEIFRDYEDYFRHVMVINSTVWQCEATGRENLTYAEALKSERRARKKMELFKDTLRPPVMLVIEHAKQSSINALTAIVFKFLRRRFFLNEEVTACHKSTTYNAYTVVDVVPPGKSPAQPSEVYEDTDKLQYKLRRLSGGGKVQAAEITVPFENIRRLRVEFTTENLQMFIKSNIMRVDGLLRPKADSYKKYVTDRNITFASVFIGKMPHFTPAKTKRPTDANVKKQSTMNKYLVKNSAEETKGGSKLSAQELAKREAEKAKKAEEKAKSLKEEMERVRREKQEKMVELERQRLEKRAKLMEKIEAECSALLTKTDDLERTDQRLLPSFTPVCSYIPTKLMGEAFMVREFMHSFVGILSSIEVFRGNLSFYEMSRAFSIREVAGPLSDILLIFLGTVFDLQKEEEEECAVEYLIIRKEMRQHEPFATMSLASRAHFYAQRHFHFKINNLPIDALTLSEVLRLHLLSSGSAVKDRCDKWRVMYRNGYTSSEDPGLALRMQHPHILRALKMYTVFQLPFIDIMRILRCLMSQILTYSSPITIIEERMDQMANSRRDLKALTTTENRRLAKVQAQRRALTVEYNQQCLDDEVKTNQDKKHQLEEKLNKKVAELLTQSDREHKRFEQQVEKINGALFNFLVYLGMDRAYRKYYVLESMPGIFVEHPPDSMDTCLVNPPQNALHSGDSLSAASNSSNLPKNRKDMRAYLLKMYTDEEKKAAAAINGKAGPTKSKNGAVTVSHDNKENQENHVVNILTNDSEVPTALPVVVNGIVEKNEVTVQNGEIEVELTPPSQYQLYMCTGDKHNCIVHDERNSDRHRWAYLYEKNEIDALIYALNPLGERESQLRSQLTVLRQLIENHVRKCPVEMLNVETKQMSKFKSAMMIETNRKYNKSNFGFPDNSDLNEVMYGTLVDRILQFESDIYTGDLGRLKVKDMVKWRDNVQNNCYDSQGKLQWGNFGLKVAAATAAGGEEEDIVSDDADDDNTEIVNDGKFAMKPFKDPGEGLGDTFEIDSEDSADESISLHDSKTLLTCVRNLASALLQVEQAIERRFIKEPFGAPVKESKDVERKTKWGASRLKQWEISLMESTSYSQVFLHLNILHDCILWARSTNKSSCQVCRRGSDPDKMLLCDECNGGTHMFCMKPKMKTVPEGNWYCQRCVTRLGLANNGKDGNKKKTAKRKRAFIVDKEEEEEDEVESISDVSIASSSVSSKSSRHRRSRGRHSSKRIKTHEIEDLLDEETEEEDTVESDDEGKNEDDESAVDDDEEAKEADEEVELRNKQHEESKAESDEEDEDNVCIVCSYDGGDLICVRCKDVFHLECVNLKRSPRYNFICTNCKSKDKRKHQPNSEDCSEEETPEEFIEPSAKRTRQSRSSLRNSLLNANSAQETAAAQGNSRRSFRRTGDNLPLNSSALYKLLEDMMKHEQVWPFLRPVSQSEVPDYYKIIKSPMDLAKVKSKLNMGEYQINEEVMNDIQLIFNNCDEYNVKGNEIYQAGSALEKYVIDRCKDLNLPFKPSDMNE